MITHCKRGHEFTKENTYRGQCKACRHARIVQWWKDNKATSRENKQTVEVSEKQCSTCKEVKSIGEFSPDKTRKDGHAYTCKACWRDYNNERYHQNPEQHYARAKAYYARHPDRRRATVRNYKRANLDKQVDWQGRRRAQKREAPNEPIDVKQVFVRDAGLCHICKLAVDPKNWHLDHVIPLSRGGHHTYSNVAVSHPKCNLSKSNKLLAA